MSIGRARGIALIGLTGVIVDVEVDVANGLPAIRLVGLADRAVTEAVDRVRSAIVNSGLTFPSQRVTISLSPAALPKSGSGFDLSIAVAVLATTGLVPPATSQRTLFVGELALDGRLRPTAGVLPAVLAARELGVTRVMVPTANLDEARLVSGIEVVGVASIREAVHACGGTIQVVDVEPVSYTVGDGPGSATTTTPATPPDLADVFGVPDAVDALVIAATGGHNLYMVGPPGAGKTMLASRLPGILPPLSEAHALEVAVIRSLVEGSRRQVALDTLPPFQAPHHTLSAAGMVGGGPGIARPGVAVLAHRGVLFLDEAPEFASNVLDCLRQPLESGALSLHRASFSVEYPSDFQLVLAANPCPCGLAVGATDAACTCKPAERRRYQARLSGPLLDRVDIQVSVPRTTMTMRDGLAPVFTSADARVRVESARAIRHERWGDLANARVAGATLRTSKFRLPRAVTKELDTTLRNGTLSMRSYDRILRVAWTLSDLDASTTPSPEHVERALLLNKGVPA